MTKSFWLSRDMQEYKSNLTVPSTTHPGVTFRVARMSFGRRLELMRELAGLSRRHDFEAAGSTLGDKLAAGITNAEMDRLYLRWGLEEVNGLVIDGQPCTPELLEAAGPEDLCKEIVGAVRRECGLLDIERKN